MESKDVTLVENAIHSEKDPRHLMRIKNVSNHTTVTYEDNFMASSNRALKLLEVGFDLYDPVYYFPREDVSMAQLEKTDKKTHCPLKGDATAYHVKIGDLTLEYAAWIYTKPYLHASLLEGHVAFDQTKLQVTEHLFTTADSA
ncbi:MAG TPA: DUF427 domain-containing protein [Cyclobacteriaceae bacterium]